MVPNYLKQENQIIVWAVLKEDQETDLFRCNIGVPTNLEMTNKELLDACLAAWEVKNEKKYRLLLIRANGEIDVPLNQTLKDVGMRNGDYLQLVAI